MAGERAKTSASPSTTSSCISLAKPSSGSAERGDLGGLADRGSKGCGLTDIATRSGSTGDMACCGVDAFMRRLAFFLLFLDRRGVCACAGAGVGAGDELWLSSAT